MCSNNTTDILRRPHKQRSYYIGDCLSMWVFHRKDKRTRRWLKASALRPTTCDVMHAPALRQAVCVRTDCTLVSLSISEFKAKHHESRSSRLRALHISSLLLLFNDGTFVSGNAEPIGYFRYLQAVFEYQMSRDLDPIADLIMNVTSSSPSSASRPS